MIFLKIFVDMLTAHTIKIIQSLDKKKYRQKYNLFLVEGNKIIKELLPIEKLEDISKPVWVNAYDLRKNYTILTVEIRLLYAWLQVL